MPNFSLRRYDTQARVGMMISLASVVSLLGLIVFVFSIDNGFQNFKLQGMVIYYGQTRRAIIYLAGAITLFLSVTGFGFSLNSAGQRRNDQPKLSWIGFFVGAAVFCLAVLLLFFFYRQGEAAV